MNQTEAESVKDLAKLCNDVLEKLGWKWEPKVGEWCIVYDKVVLIYKVSSDRITVTPDSNNLDFRLKKAIPILPWEEIERVLEEIEFELSIDFPPHGESPDYPLAKHHIWIFDNTGKTVARAKAKSRQEAVMRSVIELGKKIDAKSK